MRQRSAIYVSVACAVAIASCTLAAHSASAPPAVAAEFNAFIAKFRAAVKENDPKAVAGLSKLPFMGDEAIASAEQFRTAVYAEDFTRKNRSCLQTGKPIYDRDQENNDIYFIFCGELIFTFTRTPAGFQFTEIGMND